MDRSCGIVDWGELEPKFRILVESSLSGVLSPTPGLITNPVVLDVALLVPATAATGKLPVLELSVWREGFCEVEVVDSDGLKTCLKNLETLPPAAPSLGVLLPPPPEWRDPPCRKTRFPRPII